MIGALSPEATNAVRDFIMAPHSSVSNDAFKTVVVDRISESKQKRINQLLTSKELGDRTPSQFLRRMKQLVGDESLSDTISLQRLPSSIQIVLASTREFASIEELTEFVNRIAVVPHRYSAVSTVTPAVSSLNLLHDKFFSEISDICSMLTQHKYRPSLLRYRYGFVHSAEAVADHIVFVDDLAA